MMASTIGQILGIVLHFVVRTIFIQALGVKYLGISGLFTNILSMLSLMELGVGSAITFSLYKPIAMKQEQQVAVLMKFYRNAYRVIGLSIAVMGLVVMPFLPDIIKDDIGFINMNLVFAIFLAQSVSSYLFFAYKNTIIKANQKEYIVTLVNSVFSIVGSVIQVVLLLVFKNYYLYVVTVVLVNILQNIYIAFMADRMYPYIRGRTKEVLPKEERKEIIRNCTAIVIYRVNIVVIKATDNIVLSTYIGLGIVGIYSNYVLIVSTIQLVLNKFYTAIQAGLGDLHAQADPEEEYRIFKIINFFTVCSFGIAAVGVFVVGNDFIHIWIGDSYVLSQFFTFLLAVELYIFGLQKTLSSFRTAMGLFHQAKYRPLFGAVINLGLSILLVQYIGISGVLIGTVVSSLVTYMWFDPMILYMHGFKKPVRKYYFMNLLYLALLAASGGISYFLVQWIPFGGIFHFIAAGLISVLVTGGMIAVFFYRTPEFAYLKNLFIKIIRKVARIQKRRNS
jgi:O-antigen/teichoic acid export membrane protein